MNTFPLLIATPDRNIFEGEAISIRVKTALGDIEILAKHSDMIAAVGTGGARIIFSDESRKTAACSGGILTVRGGGVKLMPTTFEYSDEIDVSRAERARERAEAALAEAKSDADIAVAKAKLSRALSRLSAAGKL